MKTLTIVQARMGSTRLPGKVMLRLCDKTVLGHVITRLQRVRGLDGIVIATSASPENQIIAGEAERYGVPVFRGDEYDVLKRFYQASRLYQPELIIRITADCPLIDPGIIDNMLVVYSNQTPPCDYMSNTLKRSFPRGLDVELLTQTALTQAYNSAVRQDEKEHVTPYIYRHPEQFRLCAYTYSDDYSHYRWTLDTQEDWQLISAIYRRLYTKNPTFTWLDVIGLLQNEPALSELNAHVQQKA